MLQLIPRRAALALLLFALAPFLLGCSDDSGNGTRQDALVPTPDSSGGSDAQPKTDGPFDASADANADGGVDGSAASWQLPPGHFVPAKLPLEIINPQPGLTTASRYYKCYPGLVWRVPISVLGGAWPFRYELVTGPAGMTIGQTYGDADYGVLSWSHPVEVGSPHAITVRVTDQEGATASVSWTLTVGKDGFLFVDATNGDDDNDGTIDHPMKTMLGWLETGAGARNLSTYDDYQVYYRSGVYYTKWDYDSEWTHFGVQPMRQKPAIHLAYPGEQPIFDVAGNGGTHPGGQLKFADAPAGANDDIFIQGIRFRGVCSQGTVNWQQGVALSQTSRVTIFENSFGEQQGSGVTGQNPAWFFFYRDTDPPAYVKKYHSFHNNQISGLDAYMLIETYDVEKMVIEGNRVTGSPGAGNRLVYFKVASRHASVRNNRCVDDSDVMLAEIGSSRGEYDEIEIAWNSWKARSDSTRVLWIGIETNVPMGQIHVHRNTLTGGTVWLQASAGGGPVFFQDNVRQYGSGVEGISAASDAGYEPLFSWQGQDTDLAATDGLVDAATNTLVEPHRATHLGKKGHEVH